MNQEFEDRFTDSRRFGRVIGSKSSSGVRRQGRDLERALGIDNGALRIRPLIHPGWGRVALAWGPFPRRPGLAFAVFMTNGHNTSQAEELAETLKERVIRWWNGSEVWGLRNRLVRWARSGRILRTIRELRWWAAHAKGSGSARLDENLAVGWFPESAAGEPWRGSAFVMHATGAENGELWVTTGATPMAAIRGIQNLPIAYIVVLRERGAAFYASSLAGAPGIGVWPGLRPIAVEPFGDDRELFAGIHQSVLGQIGFRLDSRVYAAAVKHVPSLAPWFGTAHAADALTGTGALAGTGAEVGGTWRGISGSLVRSATGTVPSPDGGAAVLDADRASGLIHLEFDGAVDAPWTLEILWRGVDESRCWRLRVAAAGATLAFGDGAPASSVATDERALQAPRGSVQIVDDGVTFAAFVNGRMLFDRRFPDNRGADRSLVGFAAAGGVMVRRFEAHPRVVDMPPALVLGEPWQRLGSRVVAADDFTGTPGPLEGRRTPVGTRDWTRLLGTGTFTVTGNGFARVEATRERPAPGRTMYTISWDEPELADLTVTVTPPGTGRGEKHHGLSGFVFWQDDDNYITMNIWVADSYGGASISTFFQIDGFEDLYDAIWANVGGRVTWGVPVRLRMVFDGMRFLCFVDDVPVLFRALTDVYPNARRLRINKVGLITNWEWGNDTGSVFSGFEARA